MSLSDQVMNMAAAEAEVQAAPVSIGMDPGEAPQIADPPDTHVELPGGYIDPSGVLHTSAVVRELNGSDEEHVLGLRNVDNPVDYMNAFLNRAVLSIGTHPCAPEIIDSLLIGDRTALALGIRKATYGKTITNANVCPHCGESLDVHVDLDDVTIKKLEDPMQRIFPVELPRGGVAEVRLPTGADQHASYANTKRLEMANTVMLARCVVSLRGKRVDDMKDVPDQVMRNLNITDRRAILNALAELQPGPQYEEVKVPCAACGEKFTPALDWADLLSG